MMTGLSLQGNATAAGLLWGLFGLHTLYALLLTIMRPLIDDLTWGTEVTSLWLEALMVLCAALLVYMPDNATFQIVRARLRGWSTSTRLPSPSAAEQDTATQHALP
jgi:hypothetical protein